MFHPLKTPESFASMTDFVRFCSSFSSKIMLATTLSATALSAVSMPAPAEPAESATFQIKTRPNRFACSGFFVSPDGYFVTALHCLSRVIEGFRSQQIGLGLHSTPITLDSSRDVKLQKIEGLNLLSESQLELAPFVAEYESPPVTFLFELPRSAMQGLGKLVALGAGFFSIDPRKPGFTANDSVDNRERLDNLRTLFTQVDHDFAVVKIDLGGKTAPCLKISGTLPVGQQGRLFGFPFTDGSETKLATSSGLITPLRFDASTEPPTNNSILREVMDPNHNGVILADASSGLSGGPVTDAAGNAIGVISIGTQGMAHFTIFSRMDFIRQSVAALVGEPKVKKIFGCR